MTTDSQHQGGKGGGAAVPGQSVDLLPRIRSGKLISEKELKAMQLTQEAKRVDAGADDDFDPIEGARREREIAGPPVAIEFPSFPDAAAQDDENQCHIMRSPSSISWRTFKEQGKPNKSPFSDVEAKRQAAIEAAADKTIQDCTAGTKASDWNDMVFEERDTIERGGLSNKEDKMSSHPELRGDNDIPDTDNKQAVIKEETIKKQAKEGDTIKETGLQDISSPNQEVKAAASSKGRQSETQNRKKNQPQDKVSNEEANITRTIKENQASIRSRKPDLQKRGVSDGVPVVTNSKEHEPSVRSRNFAAEERGYATEPERSSSTNRKKERMGFGFSNMLRKKSSASFKRRKKKNESSKKAAAVGVMSDDEDGATLLHSRNAPSSSTSTSAREKGILNRVFKLGKSRQPKNSDTVPTSNSDKRAPKSASEIEDEHLVPTKSQTAERVVNEVVPSTPVRQPSIKVYYRPSPSDATPIVSNRFVTKKEEEKLAPISISTPVKKVQDDEEDEHRSLLATIIVTPIKEMDPGGDLSKSNGLSPANDTPTTIGSEVSSIWNLSPENNDVSTVTPFGVREHSSPRKGSPRNPSPRNPSPRIPPPRNAPPRNATPRNATPRGGARKNAATDRPMMLPPAMPPSMVSCKSHTMEEEQPSDPVAAAEDYPNVVSAEGSTADDASIEVDGTSSSSNTGASSRKEDPPSEAADEIEEQDSKGHDPPGAQFEQAVSRGVLSSVLSEEGYENPSIYTIPNPMPNGWPMEPAIVEEDDGGTEENGADDEEDVVANAMDDDCSEINTIDDDEAQDNDDTSLEIAYNNGDNIIGTSADVCVELSSVTHTEAYNDIEVIQCVGLEDIEMGHNQSHEISKDREQDSSKQSSKATKSTKELSDAKSIKTQESDEKTKESERTNRTNTSSSKVPLKAFLEATSKPRETSKTVPMPLVKQRSSDRLPLKQQKSVGRSRLGRSKIRAAASTMMNRGNNNNAENNHRSKSRDRKRNGRSKSRDVIRRSGKSGKNIGKRLGLIRRQSIGGEANVNEKSKDNTSKTNGLSHTAKDAMMQDFNDTPLSFQNSTGNLVITPVSSPIMGNKGKNGYRSLSRKVKGAQYAGLSQDAKHELAREKELEETLEEIEVSFGRESRQYDFSGKQKGEKKIRGRNMIRSRSRLSQDYYDSDGEEEDNSSYDTPDDDDDSTYNREESSEDTGDYADGSCSNSIVSKNNSKYSDFVSFFDDETEYTDDRGNRNCQDNCTAFEPFGIPQDEIMEDLMEAFEDTIGTHITQMIKSFDITEGLVSEARERMRDQSRDVRRVQSSSNTRRTKSRDRNGRRRKRSSGGESPELHFQGGSHERNGDQQQRRRGNRPTSKRVEATKRRSAERTSIYRRMEL